MGLTIELDAPKKSYLPGHVVKGNVVLHSEKDEPIEAVLITFVGRSKTKIFVKHGKSSSSYRSLCTLFSCTKRLYSGKYTFNAGRRHSWPFEFEFPTQTDPLKGNDKFDSAGGSWPEPKDPHPLPPTFTMTILGYNSSSDCSVEYKLEAELSRPRDAPSSRNESSLDLTYLPSRREEFPSLLPKMTEQSFTARSLRLLPERKHDRLSIKEKLWSTFKNSELPCASFTVELAYPTQIYPGGPFPITLALKGMQTSEDVTADPTVTVKQLIIKVSAEVFCRGEATLTLKEGNFSLDTVIVDTFGDINVELPGTINGAEAGAASPVVDLGKLGKTKFSTQAVKCDFQTYNITLRHMLDVKAKLLCGGKDFKLNWRSPLKVLSPAYSPFAVPGPEAEPSSSQAKEASTGISHLVRDGLTAVVPHVLNLL